MADHSKKAVLYRMVMDDHICPFGLKSRHLLKSQGYRVEDHWLTTRAEVEAFKAEHDVKTTPQTFIDGARVGGYDALRSHFGKARGDSKLASYQPVLALFAMAALMALAVTVFVDGVSAGAIFSARTLQWFVAMSMCLLALQKLRDVGGFANSFLNYDLLAQRWVPYAYLYPLAEGVAGLLMLAGALLWLAIPLALFIGTVGAVSVFKAVYIDRRELTCACVGGDSKVPLGAISLTENLMMAAMAVWMLLR